ncbi:cytochrome P450 [Colletotrichum godetiae]|uniref:Cytochrome P450 n=1 Tax=Colletotrichum godetiae TaxID=1209918 RepID=A0AAJ0AL83_9PEZI|nr:cytochrome P450 [Colletotrichum godetiae]KAK1675963.1 cytochrome P450 [Colletotrichum godetiae]
MDVKHLLPLVTVHPFASITAFLTVLIGLYTFYYRNIHPLSRFPGPFLASLTNFWRLRELWSLHLPDTLVALHEKYGDVVRVGPNMLSFRQGSATKFYDGFTSFNPNLFGTQDEEVHSTRRRQMAHAFSLQSIKEMEQYIDGHMLQFRKNLDEYSKTRQVFDLKELIAFFVLDVLGDLAFRCQFDSQIEKDISKLPPINDHIFLACLMGMVPDFMPFIKTIFPWIPIPWLQGLLAARQNLKNLTAECVRSRITDTSAARKDLITSLINSVDPETGSKLTELDIQTEAFAFIVAGSHTTSGTLTLLFSHILQNPAVHEKVVEEVDAVVENVGSAIVPIKDLETRLPYVMACLDENFRMNSVFTMPLERKVTATGGFEIEGHVVPKGTGVFSLNHVVHHNPAIWGKDHNVFDPSRFYDQEGEKLQRFLSPFSMGHRMCIGRNMAMTNMLKLVATTFKCYELEMMMEPEHAISTISVGISEKEGPLMCRVRRR